MVLPNPKQGSELKIKGRPLAFSFWPMNRTTRRYGLGHRVFSTNPWPLLRSHVRSRCPAAARDAAVAFLGQAEDYYRAADRANTEAAKPVLIYYCFLNLAKAFVLTVGQRGALDDIWHGLHEKFTAGGRELLDAYLYAKQTQPPTRLQAFDEFLTAVQGAGLTSQIRLNLPRLMPQIVPGHRLWAAAASEVERFVAVHKIEICSSSATKEIWLRLYCFADDLQRLELGHQDLLVRARLASDFRQVKCSATVSGRRLLCFEQIHGVAYGHRPSDKVADVVGAIKSRIWTTVSIVPPYRRYYLYPAPVAEHGEVIPQLLSIYAMAFYLGSITRYRPHHFQKILRGEYGPVIEAFLNDQPDQFLYLLASEFAQQEVAKAALV